MLHLGRSSTELLKSVVEIQRRFLADPEAAQVFEDLLALLVQASGSNSGFLGKVSCETAGPCSFEPLADSSLSPPEGVDWPQLCKTLVQEGQATFFVPSGLGESSLTTWWALPCFGEARNLVGVAALAGQPLECDEELMGLLHSLCELCGVMIDADRLEHRKRELARQAGEARYRSFADHTTDGLFIHDDKGTIVDVNLRACESLGYSREELIGSTPLAFDPAINLERLSEHLQRLIHGESLFFESRHRRKDGTTFPVEIRVSPFQQNGRHYALALACDITERKKVEEQLRASEAKFRALAINAPVAIFIKDLEGRYTVANPLACEALGRPEGVEGVTDHDLLPKPIADKFRRNDLEILATGKAMEYEDLVEREGYSRQYLAVKFPLWDAEGKATSVCGVATDITERKRAEEALRDSEERFRALVDVSSQIVWTVGGDGQVDRPVPSWEAFTGQTHEESVNEGWSKMIHPDDRASAIAHWHHCSSTGEQFEIEYRLWHAPTQRWRWTKVCGVCLRNADGSIRSWVGMHNDITERKEAADALQLSEARYRNFVDHATDGLFLQDCEGRIVDVNRLACENLGYTREELIGKSPLDYDPDLTPEISERRIARLNAGETLTFDSRHRRKDGTTFPVEVRIRPFWVDGQRYAISLVQDITERKRAERSLRLTQFSVDHAAIAVFWVTRDSTIRYVNDLACESLRYTREQLVGKSLLEITDHTPESWEARFDDIKQQQSVTFESQHTRSDGTSFPIEVTVHYDEFDGDEFLFAFAQDITDRKEAESRFEKQAAELLHASRLSTVGEMVAALSHEVAQPLSAIGNFAAACEKIIGSPDENGHSELSEYVAAIIKQNRRCATILQRLRDYSRRASSCRTECDLAHLLRESAELVSSELRSRAIEMNFDLPKELPVVMADRVQLQQVVVNLLTNARDAVCDEEAHRRVVTLRAMARKDAVAFQVEDSGQGFPGNSAEQLFEPFYTTKKNGMGIGLSICHSIVHDHGGKIDAFPNESGGATFRVSLPLPRSQPT